MTRAYLRPWRRRPTAVLMLALTAILLTGVVVVFSPRFILAWDLAGTTPPADRAKAINDIRASLLQGLAGLGLLLGVVFTWRQIQVTRQAHAGDRFTTAVQHLADENLDIRVAGIYALETLAATYATERDAVIDVLSTFLRRHATVSDDQRSRWLPTTGGAGEEAVEPLRVYRPDISVALRVLARRTPRRGEVLHLDRLAVASAKLEFAPFANADLHYSDLRSVDLHRAMLRHADLTGSNLTRARLTAADLRSADLRKIVAGGLVAEQADLRGADLSQAYLASARLGCARLNGADLRGADLTDADLAHIHIEGALADDTTTWPATTGDHKASSSTRTPLRYARPIGLDDRHLAHDQTDTRRNGRYRPPTLACSGYGSLKPAEPASATWARNTATVLRVRGKGGKVVLGGRVDRHAAARRLKHLAATAGIRMPRMHPTCFDTRS